MEPEGTEMLAALGAVSHRFAAVGRQVRDPTKLLPNSTWTAADLVAHVAAGVDAYARYLEGNTKAFVDVSDLAGGSLTRSNDARLAEFTERDIPALLKFTAARLAELRVPVTLIVGAADVRYTAIAERMRADLPNASLAVVAAAGHTVLLDQPQVFTQLVKTALDMKLTHRA